MPPLKNLRTRSVIGPLVHCGADAGCTTGQQKTHISSFAEVLYPWHPWNGWQVAVVQDFVRGGLRTCRCRCGSGRTIELPHWMLDRTACCRISLAQAPVVGVEDLRRLSDLLAVLRGDRLEERHFPEANPGDAHDQTTFAPCTSSTPPVSTSSTDPTLGSTSQRGAPQGAAADRVAAADRSASDEGGPQ